MSGSGPMGLDKYNYFIFIYSTILVMIESLTHYITKCNSSLSLSIFDAVVVCCISLGTFLMVSG